MQIILSGKDMHCLLMVFIHICVAKCDIFTCGAKLHCEKSRAATVFKKVRDYGLNDEKYVTMRKENFIASE